PPGRHPGLGTPAFLTGGVGWMLASARSRTVLCGGSRLWLGLTTTVAGNEPVRQLVSRVDEQGDRERGHRPGADLGGDETVHVPDPGDRVPDHPPDLHRAHGDSIRNRVVVALREEPPLTVARADDRDDAVRDNLWLA